MDGLVFTMRITGKVSTVTTAVAISTAPFRTTQVQDEVLTTILKSLINQDELLNRTLNRLSLSSYEMLTGERAFFKFGKQSKQPS